MAPFPPSCTALIPMSARDYLAERDSAAFRSLLAEILDLGEIQAVESWHEGDVRYEKLVTIPDYERWVPRVGRKYVRPADICFYDIIEYDPAKLHAPPYRLSVTSELPLLGEKMEGMRTIIIDEVDARTCRHTIEGEVRIKIFGVGKIAEGSIIDGTVKTFRALPAVVERYIEVRAELLRAPGGAAALFDGVPDMLLDASRVAAILQRPYEVDDSVVKMVPEAEALQAEGGEEQEEAISAVPHQGAPLPAKQLQRSETLFYDAEDNAWVDPEWSAALEETAGKLGDADRITAAAIEHDEQRALQGLRKLAPSHMKAVLLTRHSTLRGRLGERRSRRAAASAEEEERLRRHNAAAARWREFWRKAKPAPAPVPMYTARFLHLLSISAAVGYIKLHIEEGKAKRAKESSAKPQQEQKQRLGHVKALFARMKMGSSKQAERITTPAAYND